MQAVEAEYRVEVGKIGRKVTGFLDLSPELRNIVYGFAFVFPDRKCVLRLPDNEWRGIKIQREETNNFEPTVKLLATCKQIHEEGGPVLYGANTFRCDDVVERKWEYFALSIGRNIQHIRMLEHFNNIPATPRSLLVRTEGYHEAPGGKHWKFLSRLEGFHEAINLKKIKIVLGLHIEVSQLLTAIRRFVCTQFKERKKKALEESELPRRKTKFSMGPREARKLLIREQAVATLDMLDIGFYTDDPHHVPISQDHRQRREREADNKTGELYENLAKMVGLKDSLGYFDHYDWRAAKGLPPLRHSRSSPKHSRSAPKHSRYK
jgi:hypothetical protein